MNEAVDKGIKEYIEKVGAYLADMPASERAQVLGNIESDIRLCLYLSLRKKNQTEPTLQDLESVISEMGPPERYGHERKTLSPAPANRSHGTALILTGAGILIVIAALFWWWPVQSPEEESPIQPRHVQNNATICLTNIPTESMTASTTPISGLTAVTPTNQIKAEVSSEETAVIEPTPVESNKNLAVLREAYDSQHQSILAQYKKALDSLITNLKNKKDLNGALVLQDEQERVDKESTIPLPTDAKDSFRPAAEVYHKAMVAALELYMVKLDQLTKKELAVAQKEDMTLVKAEWDRASALLANMQQTKPAAKEMDKAASSQLAFKPTIYGSSARGGTGNVDTHNIYKFHVKTVGQSAKLRFWAAGSDGTDTCGKVTLTTPQEDGRVVYYWQPKDFKMAAKDVKAYRELAPIMCDISDYVKKIGTYEVCFKWTSGPFGLNIFRVELEIN